MRRTFISLPSLSPPLLLLLLLLLLPPRTLAQPATPTPTATPPAALPLDSFVALTRTVQHGTRAIIPIRPRADGVLSVDWRSTPATTNELIRDGRPHIILSAAVNEALLAPVITPIPEGTNTAAEGLPSQYDCSVSTPCLRTQPPEVVMDDEAFFTEASLAFVRLNVSANAIVYISIENYARGRRARNDTTSPISDETSLPRLLEPVLNGILTLRLLGPEEPACPGWTLPEDECDDVPTPTPVEPFSATDLPSLPSNAQCGQPCSGGDNQCAADGRKCMCQQGFDGRFCETPVLELPTSQPSSDGTSPSLSDGSGFLEVPPFSTAIYSWTQTISDSKVILRVRIHNGITPGDDPQLVGDPTGTHIAIHARPRGINKGIYLSTGPILPSVYDELARIPECSPVPLGSSVEPFDCFLQSDKLGKGSIFFIALTANATGINPDADPPRPAVFSVRIARCDGRAEDNSELPRCPLPSSPGLTIPFAILPICIVTIGLTMLSLFVLLWFDRRHGFTNPVDRLSPKELSRMYPAFKHHSSAHPQRSIPSPTDLPSDGANPPVVATSPDGEDCSICLSQFENLDSLRRLRCEHTFHCECIDPWLTRNNATCPTCRADTRIEQFSDKRRLRKIIVFFLGPLVYIRRLRERRNAAAMEAEENESGPEAEADGDIEAGTNSPEQNQASQPQGNVDRSLMPVLVSCPVDPSSLDTDVVTPASESGTLPSTSGFQLASPIRQISKPVSSVHYEGEPVSEAGAATAAAQSMEEVRVEFEGAEALRTASIASKGDVSAVKRPDAPAPFNTVSDHVHFDKVEELESGRALANSVAEMSVSGSAAASSPAELRSQGVAENAEIAPDRVTPK